MKKVVFKFTTARLFWNGYAVALVLIAHGVLKHG